MRPFQIILLGIFLSLAIGGVIVFATFRGFGGEENPYGTRVDIWGTLDRNAFEEAMEEVRLADSNFNVVQYRQLDHRTFQNELVNAIAEGRGPDLVIFPNDLILSEKGKIAAIPYETISLRTFKDTYVDGTEVFLGSDGVYGIPFAVDPLVMYWNRPLFASRGLSGPPVNWEELVARTLPAITERTESLEIIRSAVALGEFSNIENAKNIVLMLFLQTGSPLVTESAQGYNVSINAPSQTGSPTGETTLRFYTDFSNPARSTYSWNRALPMDRNEFLSGDLALYFGFGSERDHIAEANPNLDFDIAEVPQGAGVTLRRGYGTFYAFAIPRSTDNFAGAYRAALTLASPEYTEIVTDRLGFAPVYRSVIAMGTGDPVKTVFYRSALIARGWLDPNPGASENVVKQMVEDVTSGRLTVSEAIADAQARLRQLLP